jgi:hypothetical protein
MEGGEREEASKVAAETDEQRAARRAEEGCRPRCEEKQEVITTKK